MHDMMLDQLWNLSVCLLFFNGLDKETRIVELVIRQTPSLLVLRQKIPIEHAVWPFYLVNLFLAYY